MNALPPIVELAALGESARWAPAWRELAGRAEPNVFGDPAFVLPALRHLGGRRDIALVLVWRDEKRAELSGVAAIEAPRFGAGLARVWRSEQAALGAAMFGREKTAQALEALIFWLGKRWPRSAGLIFPLVDPGGRFTQAAQNLGRTELFHRQSRAAQNFGGGAPALGANGKRRKEWSRLERRLAERGRLETRVGAEDQAIARFLALEVLGWKGARGTALAADSRRVAFAREMLGNFSRAGQLRIHQLTLDGAAIAAGVELRAARRAFFWKIAYDETYAAYSPGVLLTRALTTRLAEDGAVDLVDSCAAPGHQMIERVWADRLDFVDLAVARAAGPYFAASLAAERARLNLRERIKSVALSFVGRTRS
jgi:CelD/BcsL family acetyltransferase involved in cellulose biosynthesis